MTRKPLKLALTISRTDGTNLLDLTTCEFPIDVFYKFADDNGIIVPPEGCIQDLGRIGELRLFVYQFNKKDVTQCSNASSSDFPNMIPISGKPFNPKLGLTRNVAWSFFSLDPDPNYKLTKDFIDAKKLNMKSYYKYPPGREQDRINVFYQALIYFLLGKNVNVEKITNPGNTNYHCQFSGGGDLFITKKTVPLSSASSSSTSLSILNETVPDPSATNSPDRSPVSEGESASGFTIEGKVALENAEKLLYQLFANITLHTVGDFITKCKSRQYSEAYIRKMDKITGYGVGYTVVGQFGFFKLEMTFDSALKFLTKLALERYNSAEAAALMDATLDYFLGDENYKLNKITD